MYGSLKRRMKILKNGLSCGSVAKCIIGIGSRVPGPIKVGPWKTGIHLDKSGTHHNKSGTLSEKWDPIGKVGPYQKSGTLLEKWDPVGIVGPCWKSGTLS